MITTTIKGIPLCFETDSTIFSPLDIDKGTLAMLSHVEFTPDDKILDLGCGYGVAGITAAKLIGAENVVMSDIDPRCAEMSRKNAELNGLTGMKIILSDGFTDIDDTNFSLILSNPPYHTDFSTAKHFIEKGFNRLVIGGRMFLVTKRRDWYKNKLIAIFGGVKIFETGGYFVFCAEKRNPQYFNAKRIK